MKSFLLLLCLVFSFVGLAQDEDEVLEQLEKEKAVQAKGFQQIDEGAKTITNTPAALLEQIKGTGGKVDPSKLLNPKNIEMFKQMLKESKMQDLPPEKVRELIMMKVAGKPMERVFKQYPKLLDIAVAIFKDREALPAFIGIMGKQDQLKFFSACALAFFIFGFVLKRLFVRKDASLLKRLTISMMVQAAITIGTFGFFYYLFEKEVGPVVRVIVATI